ncbi:MAG: OmpA family protein [Bacteroidales bacterium]
MKKQWIFTVLLTFSAATATSQPDAYPWAIGFHGGKNEYSGDRGNAMFNLSKAFYGFAGISLYRNLGSSFDLGISGSSGHYGYYNTPENRFLGRKTDASILLTYKLNNGYILHEEARFAPGVVVGLGVAAYSEIAGQDGYINAGDADLIFQYGARLRFGLTERMALQYQLTSNFTNEDKRDYWVKNKNDHYLMHSVGLVFCLGRKKETVIRPQALPLPEAEPDKNDPADITHPPVPTTGQRTGQDPAPASIPTPEDLLFDTGRFRILPEHHPLLDEVVKILQNNPSYTLEIQGHTDNAGLPADNMILSNQRAEAAKAFLLARGLNMERMTTSAFGEHNPAADNATEEGRSLNRRVTFIIIVP